MGDNTPLDIVGGERTWVSRGAHKLLAALERWEPEGLTVSGVQALDLGASTGGFTEVLLDHGAAQVVALDVGTNQLVPELARDSRVHDISGTSLRDVDAQTLLALGLNRPDGRADLVVGDLSFISLTLVMHRIAGLTRATGDVVLLVKPQFEVGKGRLGKKGVVTNPAHRVSALREVVTAATETGLFVRDLCASPITGGEGNIEYLLWARPDGSGKMDDDEQEVAIGRLGTGGQR